MLKLPIYSAIWIFIILLLVSSAIKTNQRNITNNIDSSSYYYNYNHHQQQHCGQLNNFNDSFVNFTHPFQEFMSSLNEINVYEPTLIIHTKFDINNLKNLTRDLDKLQILQKSEINNVSRYTAKEIIPSVLINSVHCHANEVYHFKSKSIFTFDDTSQRFVKENEKQRRIDKTWKGRTLCAVHDDESYSKQTFQDNENKKAGKMTLVDYDEPIISIDGIEDQDSLKTHVRVKRNEFELDPLSSLTYQEDYLKDLANSFPRNAYESIDENSYDDVSFDAKREIKSQEFSPLDETDRSKNINTNPFVVSSPDEDDTFAGSDSVDKINALESPKDDNLFVNRRSTENTEVEDLPEDPMLAMDLVRKKRNNLMKKALSDSQSSEQHLNVEDQDQKLSGLVAANLKAHLLRLKRRAKNNRQQRNSKPKKKKQGTGKKQCKNSLKSTRNAKNSNKLRTPRERKASGTKSAGKSNVGITNVVSKKNNKSNFHRRFVESKKSIERTNSKNDRASKNPALEDNDGNSIQSKEESVATGSDEDDDLTAGSNDAPLTQNEKQQLQETMKLREKRNKNSQGTHGFLNKEDELRYYENIREPEMHQCVDHNKRQRSVMSGVESNRAVRSIEEVKDLAKKLVTKVNELQNFINTEELKTNEKRQKRIETRAIDDLCSNVSTSYDAFKEQPKIIQKCVSTSDKDSSSPAKIIVERKIDPSKLTKEVKLVKGGKGGSMTEKKRSIGKPKATSGNTRTIRTEDEKGRKWGRWTDWSSCSVTCGKGRQIRWRYCLRDCSNAETEMEEKACQLPACPPGKFLGIF